MHGPTTRSPAVAGTFYEARPAVLRAEVERLLRDGHTGPAFARRRALGVMVPHAGYRYSGAVCARALASIEVPERVLIAHTKHRPGGGPLSLASFEHWQTPLGDVRADRELTAALAALPGITTSDAPHVEEHAAEVVLPFLQVLRPDVRVAVLSVGALPAAALAQAAHGVAHAIAAHAPVLFVASSDMNHYEDHDTTLRKDALALAELQRFDPEAMLEVCDAHAISMCGAYATALMLLVARELGAKHVELLEHTTSALTSGDYEHTVGYASARVW